ncbi:hypothetical protein FOZ63_033841, partial [Perkinsus olseni]
LPVRYTKVKGRFGQPGYFDVNFTDYDQPRRFTRLMPVSMFDIPLRGDPPQAEFYNFTEAGVLNDGIVRRFKGMVNGSMIKPEAFFFKLPTDSTQYGLLFSSGTSFMLYRTDEVALRDHDILPPW